MNTNNTLLLDFNLSRFFRLFFTKPIKLNIGSGGISPGIGWLNTDMDELDITNHKDWRKLFFFLKADIIFAEHVWEHLTLQQAQISNEFIFKYLKPNGRFRIAVPDGFHPDQEYINFVKPGGHGPGADDHKFLYTYITMRDSLIKSGFKVELLEYWDENGKFHFNEWSTEQGKVLRSKRFDQRNVSGELKYTSLIIDAVKPNA